MAQIGGYRSPVDIGLARSPSVADPELYEELTPVYNAIHLLNQYLDRLRLVAEGGGSGQNPGETLPFNRFFIGTALQTIAIGDVVSPATGGMAKGALSNNPASSVGENNFLGIALTAAAIGQDFRVGIGPAVIAVPGAVEGSFVWCYPSQTTDGDLSGLGTIHAIKPGPATGVSGGTAHPMVAGIGIFPGYALVGKFVKR